MPEMGEAEQAPHTIVDDAKGAAEQQAYHDAVGDGEPTGAEPITDLDGTEVPMSDMPANGVWPGQSGELREQEAPAQVESDEAAVGTGEDEDLGTETRVLAANGVETPTEEPPAAETPTPEEPGSPEGAPAEDASVSSTEPAAQSTEVVEGPTQ